MSTTPNAPPCSREPWCAFTDGHSGPCAARFQPAPASPPSVEPPAVIADPRVPRDTVEFRDPTSGALLGKIVNLATQPVAEPAATEPDDKLFVAVDDLRINLLSRLHELDPFVTKGIIERIGSVSTDTIARIVSYIEASASLDAMRVERDGLKAAINQFADTFDTWMALPDDYTLLPEYVAMSAARERLLSLRSPEAGT